MTFEAVGGDEGAEARCAKKVLIVEDNDLNMKLFNDLLEGHGYHTMQARDGAEVLKLAREYRPNLLLMDVQLPTVSGLQATQWLKEDPELRTIPVIALTAFAMRADEEKIRAAGCDAYLTKPIDIASFLGTVARFLSDAPAVR
jgi:two-component system cell cycle response regulator DivK